MATFKRAPMPRAGQFVNPDLSLTVPALNYLGNLEKVLDALQGLNGSNDAFLASASEAGPVASITITPVTTAWSHAGSPANLAEITAMMDELQVTTVPNLNANIAAVLAGVNAIIAALKAANLMEP